MIVEFVIKELKIGNNLIELVQGDKIAVNQSLQ